MKIKVENQTNLYRDSDTNAIVNTNITEYKNYMNSLKHKKRELNKMKQLEDDVQSVKDDLKEIKDLLKCLIKE
jgi:cell shape-determining protein MreC